MQLTCPECGARYAIDGALIPPEGRRVQCSTCDHVWHADAAATAAVGPDEAEAAPAAETSEEEPAATPPSLSDDVRAILRAEAERDAKLRRERGPIETQPDLAVPPANAPARRPARRSGGALPDPEEINATLRAASDRAADLNPRRSEGRGGFALGVLLGLGLVVLAAAAYIGAPRIAGAVPAAAPTLDVYVAAVDSLRETLGHWLGGAPG